MNVMGYAVLEENKLPDFLKQKPQWLTCMAVAAALLMTTLVAVGTGIIIGYTYCYLEYQAGFNQNSVNLSQSNATNLTNWQVIHIPIQEPLIDSANRTINGALTSNFLWTKIQNILGSVGHNHVNKSASLPAGDGK